MIFGSIIRQLCLGLGLSLTACTLPDSLSPVTLVENQQLYQQGFVPPEKRLEIHEQAVQTYRCAAGKIVNVQPTEAKNSKTITVTFNQTSHLLSSTLTKKGKKYSNIRWIWVEEFDGRATLHTNQNKILAKNCVKEQ